MLREYTASNCDKELKVLHIFHPGCHSRNVGNQCSSKVAEAEKRQMSSFTLIQVSNEDNWVSTYTLFAITSPDAFENSPSYKISTQIR